MRVFRLAAIVVAAVFCGLAPAPAADRLAEHLRSLERPGWPRFLERLDLAPERSYVVIMHAPPRHAIDLRSGETALRSLDGNAGSLFSPLTSKTQIGHAMVAWQCRSGRGFASVTGDSKNRAMTMVLRDGWGVTPMLSSYDDGRIDDASRMPAVIGLMLSGGRGNVLAAEVTETECQRLRGFVAAYVSHPRRPARRYGLLLRPELFEGAGCASFALEAARRAGLFGGNGSVFKRSIELPRSIMGWRRTVPHGVRPFASASNGEEGKFVGAYTLLTGPWDTSAGKVRVTLVDPELLFAAITALRPAAESADDWRKARALSASDPAVARAVKQARRWARRYHRVRIVHPGGISALVLER